MCPIPCFHIGAAPRLIVGDVGDQYFQMWAVFGSDELMDLVLQPGSLGGIMKGCTPNEI